MSKKDENKLNRRSFISDTSKTLLYGTITTAAFHIFFQGCKKSDASNLLKEGSNESHFCDDYYVCTDSRGFTCPSTGEFHCGTKMFSCYVVFTCTAANNFYCQPSTSYFNDKGGAGS